jgi:hypothetical protein
MVSPLGSHDRLQTVLSKPRRPALVSLHPFLVSAGVADRNELARDAVAAAARAGREGAAQPS